jgi:hypothetical protein
MGVALPLALLGLLGVGIPLWIHRVRRRMLRELALPTIALLERARQKKKRALSFRDRPLLMARIALVALFALALARPYLSRVASYATERPIAIAIVLDDSMSMQRRARRGGTLFDAARARAEHVLAELAPDSEAAIVLAGGEPRLAIGRTTDTAAVRERLSTLDRSGGRGTALSAALGLGLRELSVSKLSAKEALVITDCGSHAAADALDGRGAHLRIECLEPRDGPGNAYITDMTLSEGSLTDGSQPHLLVSLSAPTGMRELSLRVRIDGRVVSEQSVPMSEGRGAADVPLEAQTTLSGRLLDARITTPNALPDDDVRELALDRAAELSVLLVDGDPAPNQLDDELRFIGLALSFGSESRSAPRLTRIDGDGLAATDFLPFDVVVLANVRAPDAEVSARLSHFVERGGGLLITSGEHLDAFAYRGRLGKLMPALPRSIAPASPALGFKVAPGESADVLPDHGVGLETASTFERLLVEQPSAPSRTVLSYTDGTPALVLGTLGTGKVALLTTSLDDDWTDLPLTPGFLPLIHGLVRGLSAVDALPKGPQRAGTVLTARVPLGARSLYLVTPDGRRVDLDTQKQNVRIDDTAAVGVYRAFAALDQRGEREIKQLSFTVVADTSDSDLSITRPRQDDEKPTKSGAGRPKGVESWFWLALGLGVVAEGVLRMLAARRRAEAQSAIDASFGSIPPPAQA